MKWDGECDVMVCVPVLWFPPGVKWGNESEHDAMVCGPVLWRVPGVKWSGEGDCDVMVSLSVSEGGVICGDVHVSSSSDNVTISFCAALRSPRIIWTHSCCTVCCSFKGRERERMVRTLFQYVIQTVE